MGCNTLKTFANKKASPDIDIGVTRGIVQVPVGQAGVRAIVPPTAQHGDRRAPHGPK